MMLKESVEWKVQHVVSL